MAPATGPRVGALCKQAGEALAERAARYGVADVLARVVAAASLGEVPEADLDLLDSAFAAHGIDSLTRPNRDYAPWPGPRAVVATAWQCPTGACPRETTREQLSCRLTGQPFRAIRLEL
ncbi:hypothetical protein [Streptomyces caeruleatus]|uniref:Uncharacterized protein n=1 Tax=Streptomyces caeruleatus TaxID=661399 RepID=A0A101TDP4_9ACTN|nr:hypothetical protein [Streptomyces caeruleatus]KUN90528.1 hypothetical protein AQJ67_43970 [Streptomyces caeruleatus]